jgi:hypothetical protein
VEGWHDFFLGELGAAAALTGLLFVSLSVNQARILELGRMADRALESLVMLMLMLAVSSAPLVPGQPLRLLGGEVLAAGAVTLCLLVRLQHSYLKGLGAIYRPATMNMVWLNRAAVGPIVLAGLAFACTGEPWGLYLLPPGILLSIIAAGANAWVLLIEINR